MDLNSFDTYLAYVVAPNLELQRDRRACGCVVGCVFQRGRLLCFDDHHTNLSPDDGAPDRVLCAEDVFSWEARCFNWRLNVNVWDAFDRTGQAELLLFPATSRVKLVGYLRSDEVGYTHVWGMCIPGD